MQTERTAQKEAEGLAAKVRALLAQIVAKGVSPRELVLIEDILPYYWRAAVLEELDIESSLGTHRLNHTGPIDAIITQIVRNRSELTEDRLELLRLLTLFSQVEFSRNRREDAAGAYLENAAQSKLEELMTQARAHFGLP